MRPTQFYINHAHGGCEYNPDTKRFAPLKIPPNVCVVFLQDSMTLWRNYKRHARPNMPSVINSRLFGVAAGYEGLANYTGLEEKIIQGIVDSMRKPEFVQILLLTRSDDANRQMQEISSVDSFNQAIYPQANYGGFRFRTFYPGDVIPDVSYDSANARFPKLGFYKLNRTSGGEFTPQETRMLRTGTYRLSEVFTKILSTDRDRDKMHVILNFSCLGYNPSIERYPDGTFKLSVPSRNHTQNAARENPRSSLTTAMNVGNVVLARYNDDNTVPAIEKDGVRYHLFGNLDRQWGLTRLDLTMGSYAPGIFRAMQKCFPGFDTSKFLWDQKYMIVGVDPRRSKFVSLLTSNVEPRTGIFYIWNVCKDYDSREHRGAFGNMMTLFRAIFEQNGRYSPTFSLGLRFDNPIFAKVLKVYAKAGFDRISKRAPIGSARSDALRLDAIWRSDNNAMNNNTNNNSATANNNNTTMNMNNTNRSGLDVAIYSNTNQRPSALTAANVPDQYIRGLCSTYTIVCKKNGALELAFGMRRRGNGLYVHNIVGNADSLIKTFDIIARRKPNIGGMRWSINFAAYEMNDDAKANLFRLADWGFDIVSTRPVWISSHEFHRQFILDKIIRLDRTMSITTPR